MRLRFNALKEFRGVGRRFERYGEIALTNGGSFTLIDDYGHHPVEMAATLAAVRGAFPGGVWCWLSSRIAIPAPVTVLKILSKCCRPPMRCCWPRCMPLAKHRLSLPTAGLWRDAVRVAGKVEPVFVEEIGRMPKAIVDFAQDGDVVITMGAGSIGAVPGKVQRGEI